MPRSEAAYQTSLVKKLGKMFPGCHIVRNDPAQTQGMPDLLILHNRFWAMLEVKPSSEADKQPNQEFYVNKFGEMSFASFIHPENEKQVLHDLQVALGN